MNTKNNGKIVVVVVLLATMLVACIVLPRFTTKHRIQTQVMAQLSRQIAPVRTYQGREERLQRLFVTDCQRSLKGHKYAISFELQYTGTLRVGTGCVVERDEWGHWRGTWSPVDHSPVQIFIQ